MVYNANYWEDYEATKRAGRKKKEIKQLTNKEVERRLREHNTKMRGRAKYFVTSMRKNPSALEKRMQELLDNNSIFYEFQKPLYIRRNDSSIKKFYIADFYIPHKGIVIETDGKFHDNQVEEDERRTREIKGYHKNIKLVRWRWHDFDHPEKIKELLAKITNKSSSL